jgi:DNA-binding CsgD family transcriptional regulator
MQSDFIVPSLPRVTRNDVVGLVLIGADANPRYINTEALQILCYPGTNGNKQKVNSLVQTLLSDALQQFRTFSKATHTITSGKRRYICRVVDLGDDVGRPSGASYALLIERTSRRNDCLRRLIQQFKLTPREREAVMFLAEGLTSKEIALKMNVSPHTVESFLRMVMIKLGVTTRSGIVGKVSGHGL